MANVLSKFRSSGCSPIEKREHLVEAWKKLLQTIGTKEAKDRNQEEKRLNSQLLETEIKLQNKGNDEILERILCDTKNKLRVLQQYKIQGQKIRAKQCREAITAIQTNQRISTYNNDIMRTFYEFYKNSFSSDNDEGK